VERESRAFGLKRRPFWCRFVEVGVGQARRLFRIERRLLSWFQIRFMLMPWPSPQERLTLGRCWRQRRQPSSWRQRPRWHASPSAFGTHPGWSLCG